MNNTTTEEYLSPYLIALRTCFVAAVVFMIITGNALSITVTRSMPELADSTKVLMISLAAYDLLTGVISLPNVIASAFNFWPFGELYCSINATLDATCCCMSIILIVLMNAERYIAVTMPFQFPSLCAKNRVIILVVLLSILSFALQIILSLIQQDSDQFIFKAVLLCIVGFNGPLYEVSILVFFVILPLIVLILIYWRLIKLSRNHAVMLNKNKDCKNDPNFLDNKALRSFLVITVLFAVCWTPLRVARIFAAINQKQLENWIIFITKGFAICNSFFNVFIYCFFNHAFRSATKRLLNPYFPCCKATIAPATANQTSQEMDYKPVKRRGTKAAFIDVQL
ncbi:histamine H2 receptor-like [Asterias amurensis]|uniref:histamine H2 receptor-like n=1 Tax=Asterias amurensis TaxID=7602 RepID=UPI003AB726E3